MIKRFIQSRAFLGQETLVNKDAGAAQNRQAMAPVARVWIDCADDDTSDAGGDNGIRARRCPAVGAARLERHIKGGAFRVMTTTLGSVQRFDLSVGQPGTVMPSAANDVTSLYDHGSDDWIRRGGAVSFSGQPQTQTHVFSVSAHFHR
jgi:hypothetical protein